MHPRHAVQLRVPQRQFEQRCEHKSRGRESKCIKTIDLVANVIGRMRANLIRFGDFGEAGMLRSACAWIEVRVKLFGLLPVSHFDLH